jgi:hypothetical protein
LGICSDDLSIAPALDVELLAPADAMQNVSRLIASVPCTIRACHFGARRQHAHRMIFLIQDAKRLQLLVHSLIDGSA